MTAALPGDREELASRSKGQDWVVSWWPPHDPPDGTPHGAAGVCVTRDDKLVLVSHDGEHWGFPAGRPEGNETLEETLRREMLEEACATVITARLLGFHRGECVNGWQRGLVLVRSFWRADVEAGPWEPEHEIQHRLVIPTTAALREVRYRDPAATRIAHRALSESGILTRIARP